MCVCVNTDFLKSESKPINQEFTDKQNQPLLSAVVPYRDNHDNEAAVFSRPPYLLEKCGGNKGMRQKPGQRKQLFFPSI